MRSLLFFSILAGLATAVPYHHDAKEPSKRDSSLGQERLAWMIGALEKQQVFCPTQGADAVIHKSIDTGDLARVQAQAIAWAGNSNENAIDPSGGGPGTLMTQGTAQVRICNMNTLKVPIPQAALKTLLDAINCGTHDDPTLGFGVTGAFYVIYGNKDSLPTCLSLNDMFHNPPGPWNFDTGHF